MTTRSSELNAKTATVEDFRATGERLRNWGRWGKDDERGTTNLITPEALVAAARLVRKGAVFDLGIPFDDDGPQTGTPRPNPVHLMSTTGDNQFFPGGFKYADDYIIMSLQCASQWDALAHVYYDDQMYNGFPSSAITATGTSRCAIDKQAKGIAGRGVLLDIAALHGVDWLPAGTAITPEDLDEAARRQGVSVGSGDILLFRTGWRRKFLTERDPAAFMAGEPGLGQDCCAWLRNHDVAAVCSDNWAIEVLPGENPEAFLNLHMILLRDMGMSLGEMLDFEELASDCGADNVWEFLFVAPPLKISQAVASPINPLAIK